MRSLLLTSVAATCLALAIPADSASACTSDPECNFPNGTCSGSVCACVVGFIGAACDQCAPDYYGYPNCTFCSAATTCSGNGTCSGLGSCACDVGFIGAACDQCAPDYYDYPSCTFCSAATTCSGNGTCSGDGSCACDAGFEGVDCSQAVATPAPTLAPWAGLSLGLLLISISAWTWRQRRAASR